MPLEEQSIERYARQIIIPEIGVRGQERLLQARVRIVGSDPGSEAARIYLKAAGISVTLDPRADVDCVIAAHADLNSDAKACLETEPLVTKREVPIVWFRVDRAVVANREPVRRDFASDALLAAVGCDAANTAIALILGWPVPRTAAGVDLA